MGYHATAFGAEISHGKHERIKLVDLARLVAEKIFLLQNGQFKEIGLADLQFDEEKSYQLRFQLYDDLEVKNIDPKIISNKDGITFLEFDLDEDHEYQCFLFHYKPDPNIIVGSVHICAYLISPFYFGDDCCPGCVEDALGTLSEQYGTDDPKYLKAILSKLPMLEYVPRERLAAFYSWLGVLISSGRLDRIPTIGWSDNCCS